MPPILNLASALSSLIYPPLCEVCGRTLTPSEQIMCLECALKLPLTGIASSGFTQIHQRLFGHCPIHRAAACFRYYRGNPYTNIIINAKYHGRPGILRRFAAAYARSLAAKGFFDGIDAIIPVPMHWTKRIRRGYNQATYIASGISGVTGIPIADNLKAVRPHRSQTRNGIRQRIQNVSGIFSVAHPSELNGLSLLVVDDVITTGSTMAQCCGMLHSQSHPAAVSVLSLALSEST